MSRFVSKTPLKTVNHHHQQDFQNVLKQCSPKTHAADAHVGLSHTVITTLLSEVEPGQWEGPTKSGAGRCAALGQARPAVTVGADASWPPVTLALSLFTKAVCVKLTYL